MFNDAVKSETVYGFDDRMVNECGAIVGMRIGKANRTSRGKSALLPLCLTKDETRAATCRHLGPCPRARAVEAGFTNVVTSILKNVSAYTFQSRSGIRDSYVT